MLRWVSTVLCILAVVPIAIAQPAPCDEAGFRPQLLTPVGGRIPRDAGLVVALVAGGSLRALPQAALSRGRRSIALVRETLAPGLFRLRPDARRVYGRWNLDGVPGRPTLTFGRPGAGGAPAQPRLERVERYLVARGSGSSTEVRAHFAFPVPPTVVAIVSYWGADPDPDLFAIAVPTTREAVLFSSAGECASLPEGASAPPEGASVRVAFVDRFGQSSPPSEPRSLGR